MADWFYKKNDQVIGPVSRKELEFLAREGRVKASTQVRTGSTGDWKRYRSAEKTSFVAVAADTAKPVTNKTPTDASEAASQFSNGSQTSSGPPKLEQDSNRTRQQAIIGGCLAVLLLLLLWFFWAQFSGSSLQGTSNVAGANTAQDSVVQGTGSGDADAAEQSPSSSGQTDDSQSPIADAGEDQSQIGNPAENSGDGAVETESAGQAAADNSQSTASVAPDNDTKRDDDLATEAMDGQDSIQAGDPMSKFTISAPGEAVFFGLRATGNRFAFVVDRSGSMNGNRIERAREELMNCIYAMPKHVEVFVVFFSSQAEPDKAGYRNVDAANLTELQDWVDSITVVGGTVVSAGMEEVFRQPKLPDSIFLLTDGDFDSSTPSLVKQLNADGSVRINTVALVSRGGERSLKQIAKENGGDYKFVP